MSEKTKILFLAANPADTSRLRLDEEIRGIDLTLRQAAFRDQFDIKQHWAVRVIDLQGYLLRHKPDIVHFSGHGSSTSEIMLEDNNGNSKPIAVQSLSRLFSLLKDNTRCVVLNACYSERQAQAIARHVDCVIGMSKSIGDLAAVNFAIAFYQAIGFGKNVKTAFDLACLQIDLESLNEQETPKLFAYNVDPERVAFSINELESSINKLQYSASSKNQMKLDKPILPISNKKGHGIFISHSWKDKKFARKLATDLKQTGVTVWFDEAEMSVGDSLIEKICQGIDEIDYVAVVLSPDSVSSEWVKKEVNIAMNQEIDGRRVKVF